MTAFGWPAAEPVLRLTLACISMALQPCHGPPVTDESRIVHSLLTPTLCLGFSLPSAVLKEGLSQ